MSPLLEVDSLAVEFGGVKALNGIDLTLEPGEYCAVIGPNGAGKTTFFNALAGVTRPTRGRITFAGHDTRRARPATMRHRGIARTFQVSRVFDSLTVAENVTIAAAGPRLLHPARALRRFGMDRDVERKVAQLLDETGLAHRADDRADGLNIGDVRRLDIARALAGDPTLLLLDEPAAGIGADGMKGLGELIASLRPRGISVLLVEHYVGWALSLCDRAVVLDMGEKIAEGEPDTVRSDPRVIKAYLGSAYDDQAGDAADDADAADGAAAADHADGADDAGTADSVADSVAAGDNAADAGSLAGSNTGGGTAEPLLDISGLGVRHGHVTAVERADLTVHAGEFVTVIGANGAGKSSLMQCVMGLVPGTGTMTYQGRDLLTIPAHRRADIGIGYVPEGRRVFSGLTVEENLRVTAGKHADDTATLIDGAYDTFPSLKRRRHQLAGNLSGGEQQMLAMSRASMLRPSLLVADEITLGLAPVVVEELFELLVSMARAGTAVLLAEQNAAVALGAADRAYVMELGSMGVNGPAAELRQDPRVIDAYLTA